MKVLNDITVPHESVNDEFVTVVSLKFSTGMPVKKDDIVIEMETSKALATVEAGADGFILFHCKEGDEVAVGGLVAQVTESPVEEKKTIAKPATTPKKTEEARAHSAMSFETLFSDKAREAMARYEVGPDSFGHLSFVTEKDVLAIAMPGSEKLQKKSADVVVTSSAAPKNVRLEKLTAGKKREIEYLRSSQRDGLASTIYVEIDVSSFFDSVRDQLVYFKDSLLPVAIYEVSRLLKKYPVFNACYVDQSIGFYEQVNIGVAMDIDLGLKVVKIPGADQLSIRETEEKLLELSNKYIDQKLTAGDLTDITFTITDLSQVGAHFFVPLINKDNSAILGISAVDSKRRTTILGLTFDHRVTEGKTATQFLTDLRNIIESYSFRPASANSNITCSRCMKKLEEDLNDVGFVKIVNRKGEDKFICDTCLLNG